MGALCNIQIDRKIKIVDISLDQCKTCDSPKIEPKACTVTKWAPWSINKSKNVDISLDQSKKTIFQKVCTMTIVGLHAIAKWRSREKCWKSIGFNKGRVHHLTAPAEVSGSQRKSAQVSGSQRKSAQVSALKKVWKTLCNFNSFQFVHDFRLLRNSYLWATFIQYDLIWYRKRMKNIVRF